MQNRVESRLRRKKRIRKKVTGTSERPRLVVYRSLKHIYAQVVDDTEGTTLVAKSSNDKGAVTKGNKTESAKQIGEALAEACLSKGISQVVFDRGGYIYHGRVRAVAEGAREKGLQF